RDAALPADSCMLRYSTSWRSVVCAALLTCALQLGCANCRLPAIDPTGQHIFSGSTTLASHDLLNGGFLHRHHQPSAVAPVAALDLPVKPPCQPPIEAVPVIPVVPVPVVAVPQNPLPVI